MLRSSLLALATILAFTAVLFVASKVHAHIDSAIADACRLGTHAR